MAANDMINISMEEVTQCAANIRTRNTELNLCLENIRTKMNALAETWQSDASDTIRENFNNMAVSFEDYRLVIDSYAKFLDDTVNAYRLAEKTISQNAGLFK
ncbi:MAG: pore-forming ESAT-6 family protein [Coprococcus sp.]